MNLNKKEGEKEREPEGMMLIFLTRREKISEALHIHSNSLDSL